MNLEELIEALDQRYGNPYAVKECGLIQQAIKELRRLTQLKDTQNEDCNGMCACTNGKCKSCPSAVQR